MTVSASEPALFKVFGWIAIVLFVVSSLPQIVKLYQTKKAEDVSLLMFIILFVAFMLMLARFVWLKDAIMIVNYVSVGALVFIVICQVVYYRYFSG
jgi:uncharacterized protein with PQ loop repeat